MCAARSLTPACAAIDQRDNLERQKQILTFRQTIEGKNDELAAEIMAAAQGCESDRVSTHTRSRGLPTIRGWLAAEGSRALLFKADRRPWIAVFDTHVLRLDEGLNTAATKANLSSL